MYKYCVNDICPLLPIRKSTISPMLTSVWFAQFCLSMRDFLQISILPNISQPRLSRQTQNSSRRKKWQKERRKKRRQVRHQMHRHTGERGRSIYWTSGIDTNKRHLTPYLPWKGWLRAKLVAAVTQSPAIGLWSSENVGLLHLQSLPKLCCLSDPKMHLVRFSDRSSIFILHGWGPQSTETQWQECATEKYSWPELVCLIKAYMGVRSRSGK